MKILIFGGTGAMGVPLVSILSHEEHDIYVTSRINRQSIAKNIHYIKGNVHNMDFLEGVLNQKYDVIIDFMIYKVSEFKERYRMFLKHTKHYIYLSSARVYSDLESPITETTPRLLDSTNDNIYLSTDEYALVKAQEENLLLKSGFRNWTIVRPYITYNDNRLQLGVLEKEYWLQRALQGKTIIFSKDIASKTTTLTYGRDVSLGIINIINHRNDALGEIYQITTNQTITWNRVLAIYLDVLEHMVGIRPKVMMLENSNLISKILGNEYQVCYDRLYNRIFDSQKIKSIADDRVVYTEVETGLKESLTHFLKGPREFNTINWKLEAQMDKLTDEKTKLRSIEGEKQKIKYFRYRYL